MKLQETIIFLIASVLMVPNLNGAEKRDDRPPTRLVVMSYNIHVAKGMDGRLDLERVAAVIDSVKPDLVSLQEVDRGVDRTNGVDQAAELARLTDMNMEFARAISLDSGEYGIAVLSRFPIIDRKSVTLPGSHRRCALAVDVDLSGNTEQQRSIMFVATHLDHRNRDDRLVSVDKIADLLDWRPEIPAILAGDLNAVPESQVMRNFRKTWSDATDGNKFFTFRADNPTHQIDYIMVRPQAGWNVLESRVLDEPVASDHLPIVCVLETAD